MKVTRFGLKGFATLEKYSITGTITRAQLVPRQRIELSRQLWVTFSQYPKSKLASSGPSSCLPLKPIHSYITLNSLGGVNYPSCLAFIW